MPVGSGNQREDGFAFIAFFIDGIDHAGFCGMSLFQNPGKQSGVRAVDADRLFGNALDNAIEAVLRLEEKKRNVGVVVRSKGDMVSVNVHNSYDGQAVIGADGFPVTTKEDKNFHGIGLKSIRQIAEKYHGICTVSTNEDTFILNVLLARK